jgi:hypothetical protein
MGLIDRVNRAFFRRLLARSPRYVVEADGVRVTYPDGRDDRLLFSSLTAASLHHRDVYAHDAIVLALRFATGETIEFAQDEMDWGPLVEALDRSGRIAEPSRIWQLKAIADGDGAPVRHLPIA